MVLTRLVPIMLLKNKGFYKTEKFRKPIYVGDPINAVKIFNEKQCDELAILDIEASRLNKEPDYAFLESIAGEAFMPLSYGGNVTSVECAAKIFSIGFEKVVIQSAALRNPSLISEITARFGVQSVCVSLDIKKAFFGGYYVFDHLSRKKSKHLDFSNVASFINGLGVGECIVTAVDKEGTMEGMDYELISLIREKINIPTIYNGGLSSFSELQSAFDNGICSIGAGAFLVFNGKHKAVLINYPPVI